MKIRRSGWLSLGLLAATFGLVTAASASQGEGEPLPELLDPAPAPTQQPSQLPATPQTGRPAPATQSSAPASAPTPARSSATTTQAYRARVEFSGGQLAITAENSSLNQILRDVAQLTGMKITGGVTEERVFGSYGPDSSQAVLSALLDGTGTNLMLIEKPDHTVQELVLTPRQGGPTPPNPSASAVDRSDSDLPPQFGPRRFRDPGNRRAAEAGQRPELPQPTNFTPEPSPQTAPPAAAAGAENSQPPATATQQSPNGVKTPQQIYEELLKMQQAGAQSAPQR
jgi:hypothetical protein